MDESDRRLLGYVRPPGWRNPEPYAKYDLVVIGGGTAGLVSAAGAAGLGARVALVERSLLGGDCLNTGCVPSKSLLRAARVVGEVREGAAVGVAASVTVDGAAVLRTLRTRRADLAPHDSAARLASLGVHVFFGEARFTGPREVAVDGHRLRFRAAVIATGARPTMPPIPGLGDVDALTSETFFSLPDLPRELIVIGGGPVGCELAQALALLGTRVTLLERDARLLSREEPDAAVILERRLIADGVEVIANAAIDLVSARGGRITVAIPGRDIAADALLVASGRTPNVEALDLPRAGVRVGAAGIEVNHRLQTTNRHVYAAGDVASPFKFTHAADAMARVVVQNALFFGRRRASATLIPWCTFTTPEIAQVGRTGDAAADAAVITVPLTHVDRAVIDHETGGFVRIYHQRGRIVGATIVAPQAGELIGTVVVAMQNGVTLRAFSAAVFPYPTLSLALKTAGDGYRREAVTPPVRSVLAKYFGWTRLM